MENSAEKIIMREYVKKLRKFIYKPLKLTGFCRFDIVNDRIVQLTYKTMIYNTFILIVANSSVVYLLYNSIILGNYLKIPDGLCILHFALFANVILLNLTFINRRSGLELVEYSIKTDLLLGVKETAFLRDIAIRTFVAINCLVTFTNISGGIFLYQVYKVSMSIHVVGSLFFFWLFFAYDDFAFAMMLCTLNSLRVRYLNVALLKIGGMNEQYLPSRSLFNLIFWKQKFNKLVKFQNKARIQEFNRAYRMCFEMLQVLERYYNFPFLCGVWTVAMGSFVAVQTFIMRVKNPTAMDNEHTYVIVGWVILSWGFVMLMCMLMDLFQQQVEQTKLICSYIQLKPEKSANIYKLTKTVLRTLELRRAVPNVYDLFYLDSGFLLKIAASTVVYITVQLQLAFPRLPLSSVKLNETSV